ncbi:hypothetical protein KJ765_04835 [Candidatus Micrarchaeota archaeon]|nr:hypothetical protein [Candidatus Micrarchaeota archaeon]
MVTPLDLSNPSDAIILVTFVTFILITVQGYTSGEAPASAVIDFFAHPRAFLVYALIFGLGILWFINWFPASIWQFVAAAILGLAIISGAA